jgi:two-component system sensor histidine kinase AgrC
MKEWYWWLLEGSADIVEAAMLVIFIRQFSEPRFKSAWPAVISAFFIFVFLLIGNYKNMQMGPKIIVYFIFFIAIECALYRGSLVSRGLLPVIFMALVLVSEVLAMGVLQLAFNEAKINFFDQTQYRMLAIIISKVLLIIFVYFACRVSRKVNYRIPVGYSLSLLFVPVISIVCMIAIGQFVFHFSDVRPSPLWFVFSAFGLLVLNLLVLYVFEAFMSYSRDQNRLQLMVQQAEMLNSHLRETNALQEETHKIWHDMKNHFTVIQWMVKSRNYDKLEAYMQTLNDTVAATMPKYQTGNPVIDALLNAKAVEAKKCGVDLLVNAAVPAKLSVEDMDLNIVLSNALDNAIEACKKLEEGKDRFVNVDAVIRNDHLVLTVKNPFSGELRVSGDMLQSTKKEAGRHGIGLGNMKRAVEKYDGHILTNHEDNLFILSAIMHCPCNK